MKELQQVYQAMSSGFASRGLDLQAVAGAEQFFFTTRAEDVLPWPKPYTTVFPQLPAGTTRIIAIPLEEAPRVASLAGLASARVLPLLPGSSKVGGARLRAWPGQAAGGRAGWRRA
jgi:hypothetical protein